MHPKSNVTPAHCCCKQATTWKTRNTIDLTPADPVVCCEHSFQLSGMASAPHSLQLPVTPHCSINSAYSLPSVDPFFSVFINVVLALLWHHKEFCSCPQVPGVKPINSGWDTYLLFYNPKREIPTFLTQRIALANTQIINLTASISCSVNSFPSSIFFNSSSFYSHVLHCSCYEIQVLSILLHFPWLEILLPQWDHIHLPALVEVFRLFEITFISYF